MLRALEHHALLEANLLHENHLEELVRQRTALTSGMPNRLNFSSNSKKTGTPGPRGPEGPPGARGSIDFPRRLA